MTRMSASLPASRLPTRSSIFRIRAAVRVIAASASASVAPPRTAKHASAALVQEGEGFVLGSLHHDDLISVIFTATPDVHSMFPATAGRAFGLGDVPLLCAQELDIKGAKPLCIRVLMHVNTALARDELRHVYLEGAQSLRDDLPA